MGWKERVQPGSFRGIPFNLRVGNDSRTKRIIVHEFPARDKAFVEERGKRPNRFTVEAFLVGDDVFEQRDNLQAACHAEGPGKLVHPYYGDMLVTCEGIETTQDSSELRTVRVTMTFIEPGDLVPIRTAVDTQAKTLIAARKVVESQKTSFELLLDYASLPYSKAQQVVALLGTALDDIAKARTLVGQAAGFAAELRNIGGSIEAILLDAEELADSLADLITFGFLNESQDVDPQPDLKQSFAELSSLFEYAPLVQLESDSTDALTQLIKGVSIAQGAHLLSLIEFDSVEESRELSNKVLEALDNLVLTNVEDDLYVQLHALRGELKRDLNERSLDLPRIVEIILPEFLPALVLSHQLYGDTAQEDAIIKRNKIAHPGILPSDIPLKVLTDV